MTAYGRFSVTAEEWNTRQRRIDGRAVLSPEAHSTLMKVTSIVTSKLTARVIVELVSLAVIPAVTLTVRLQRLGGDLASRFRPAPAGLAAVLDTAPRPLIPPSQRRREGSAAGVAKNRPQNGRHGLHLRSKFQ